MSYLVMARKYRPQSFEAVVGQSHVTQTLQNAIKANRLAHALLLSGPRGVGKTSVARIVAKAMNCANGPTAVPCNVCTSCKEITDGVAVDVFEIDGASNRGIDQIRELRENTKYMPGHGRFKIYIIDEVHMLTAEAFNALLKTLEEPPVHVLFIFATTEPQKIPPTILSRCQRHDFRRIGLEEIVKHLKEICEKTSLEISDESLRLISREGDGSMRDALSLLDQIMAYSDGAVSHDQVLDILGAVDRKVIFDLSAALLARDSGKAFSLLDEVYNRGHDLKRLLLQMVKHFRNLVVIKMGHAGRLIDATDHELKEMESRVGNVSLESLDQIFNALFQADAMIRLSSQPKLVLEMLFIKLARLSPVVSLEEIIAKLDRLAGKCERAEIRCGVAENHERTMPAPPHTPEDRQGDGEKAEATKDSDQAWQQLLAMSGETCPTLLPSLERSTLSRVGDDFIEITVSGNSFYAARLRDKKSVEVLQNLCEQCFKRRMKIKVVESAKPSSAEGQHDESDKARKLKKDALSHPLVTDALKIFHGRVVDVKIL